MCVKLEEKDRFRVYIGSGNFIDSDNLRLSIINNNRHVASFSVTRRELEIVRDSINNYFDTSVQIRA